MKEFAIAYLLGFITTWGPIIFYVIINQKQYAYFTPERRVNIVNWAAATTAVGFWLMVFSAIGMLIVGVRA